MLIAASGCRSAFIAMTITNHTAQPIELLEVDYPSASFGTQGLAPGKDFHYRFKVLGSGITTLLWTDAAHHDHKLAGPKLTEGDQGSMAIVFAPGGPVWTADLKQQ